MRGAGRGQKSTGRGEGENPRGGAGRGEKARKSTNSKILQNVLDQNFASVIVFFISPVHWFHISQQDIVRYNGAKMCQLNHDLVKVKELFIFLLYFQKHVLLSLWRLHNVHIIITIHL